LLTRGLPLGRAILKLALVFRLVSSATEGNLPKRFKKLRSAQAFQKE
jgi:hypothetical protein